MPDAISFDGLRVLSLESRRSTELGTLIVTYGGTPIVAPALREVPLESNPAALDFGARLLADEFDVVVFLTGVGARALFETVETRYSRQELADALSRTKVVVRGPKPQAVLREMKVPIWIAAPEPNTWREVVAAFDERAGDLPLDGVRIAVQEYGVSNPELLEQLRARRAQVTPVPVYRWALPDNLEPLKQAVLALARGDVDVVILTTSMQLVHISQVAAGMGLERELRQGLRLTVLASIGPTTSSELRRHDLEPDIEASHPKIGVLVRETAQQAPAMVKLKRR